MKIIGIIDEDFVNYMKPSMIIEMPYCSMKCNIECGSQVCHNTNLATAHLLDISPDVLIRRYIGNNLTDAIVFQGLEPFDSFEDLLTFIHTARVEYGLKDDIVIYSGYYKEEINPDQLKELSKYPDIYIKWGRYLPNQSIHFDEVLGVNLASDNQYAQKFS